ncbi:unannotated protein [freshwater metagenome]|uniref:Unannotated protein n=1 Tax=freshwater metagenome TaxID=449393 RepID=A0A6J6FMX3_9ZZZZ
MTGSICPTITGASPRDSSSMSRMRGFMMKLIASANICC